MALFIGVAAANLTGSDDKDKKPKKSKAKVGLSQCCLPCQSPHFEYAFAEISLRTFSGWVRSIGGRQFWKCRIASCHS